RIVIVAEQHDGSEEAGQREIEHSPLRDVPEGKRGEKRQTRVAGEKQVAAVKNRVEERRRLLRIDRRWRHVGERHEHGTDQQEQRGGLEREWQPVRSPGQQAQRNGERGKCPVNEQKTNVV